MTDIYDQVLENLDLARYSKLSTIYSHFLLPTNSPHPLEDEREKTFHDSAAALNIVLKSDDMPECVLRLKVVVVESDVLRCIVGKDSVERVYAVRNAQMQGFPTSLYPFRVSTDNHGCA